MTTLIRTNRIARSGIIGRSTTIDTPTGQAHNISADATMSLGATGSMNLSNPPGDATVFGALTRQGEGGVSVTGSSISSGDPSGHWAIANGRISPSATGEGSLSGTYNLTFNDATSLDITIAANRYDVRDDTERDAVLALGSATLSGKTVNLRGGTYGPLNLAGKVNTSHCIIQSDPLDVSHQPVWSSSPINVVNRSGVATIAGTASTRAVKFNDGSGTNPSAFWTLKNLKLYRPSDATSGNGSYIVELQGCNDIKIERCEICCDKISAATNPEGAKLRVGVGMQGSGNTPNYHISITDCFLHDLSRGTNLRLTSNTTRPAKTGRDTISRNLLHDIWLNPLEIIDTVSADVGQLDIEWNVLRGHFADSDDDPGLHHAGIAFQVASGHKDIQINANIWLAIYDTSTMGAPDLDNSACTDCGMRGNFFVGGTQNTGDPRFASPTNCVFYFNGCIPRVQYNQARTGQAPGPRINFTGTIGTGNVAKGNISCGENPSYQADVDYVYVNGTPVTSYAGITISGKNLMLGNGGLHSTTNGVLTSYPNGAATAKTRLIDIFDGVNANGDFSRISDPMTILKQSSASVTDHGEASGPLSAGGNYVTWSGTQLTNPVAGTINGAME